MSGYDVGWNDVAHALASYSRRLLPRWLGDMAAVAMGCRELEYWRGVDDAIAAHRNGEEVKHRGDVSD